MSEKHELWEQIHRGDAKAFDTFYAESAARLQRFLRQLVGSPQVAEDISHETFLRFWRRPSEYCPEKGSPQAYLFGIARKRAAEWWRQRKPEELDKPLSRVLDDGDAIADATLNANQNIAVSGATVEDCSLIGDAFSRLEPDQRALLWLREVEGQSYAEMAGILDIPVGTVRSRLHAARAELRRIWHSAPPEAEPEDCENGEMQKKGGLTR
ncbi:MAG TPA: RNA polymerase sigma factor [Candidatus Angelobacter sp.]|nr:RNA polymerase sigma factor [Candidatus Angelobacter sp.]